MKKKIKNKILRLITLIAFFVCLISAMSIEQSSNEWLPFVTAMLSLGWLTMFGYANRHRLAGVDE